MPTTKLASELNQSVAEAEQYISDLVAEGLLPAEIEAPSGDKPSIVRFTQPTSSLDVASEVLLREQLESQAKRIQALDIYVDEADHRLAVSKEYAEYVRHARKTKATRAENGGSMQDVDDFAGHPMLPLDEEEDMVVDPRDVM
jgi:COP9 signalosome complex subunit 3